MATRPGLNRSILAFLALISSAVLAVGPFKAWGASVYQDAHAPLEARVSDLFSQLTQDEKLSLLSGTGFTTQPIPRLGIPPMGMVDAGQGVRGGTQGTQGPATLFPAEVVMASTWDVDLLRRIGHAIGQEVLNKGEGASILLGPDINIHRSPLGGRNGESFTEDPFLNGALATAYVQGVQSTGASACVKHYVANNEEVDRGFVDVRVDDRTLREIYLPGFRAGVQDGHAWSVMAAYNKINGPYATANRPLLTSVLKDGWGFDGLVMSDWGAVHETAAPVNAGTDLEMPGGEFMTADKLRAALQAGSITQASIDESVRRILRTIIRVGLLDGPRTPDHSLVNSAEHQKLTLETASKGIILLKNERNILPLDRGRIHSIAVIGPSAIGMQFGAEGSPSVQPFFTVTPLDGIKKAAGAGITVKYAEGVSMSRPDPATIPGANLAPPGAGVEHGLQGEYFASDDLSGTPTLTRIDPQIQFFPRGRRPAGAGEPTPGSVRWTGILTPPATGRYTMVLTTAAAGAVFIDDKPIINAPAVTGKGGFDRFNHSGTVELAAGRSYRLRVELRQAGGRLMARLGWIAPEGNYIAAAAEAARHSDVAVVLVNTGGTEGEGRDRPSMTLPGAQNALIEAVAAANHNTIVVLNSGTPCLVNAWLDRVPALLSAGFPGEEAGNALAAILFGDVNPSGKLTDTVGARREDYPDYGHFPGTNGVVDYAEGIYVGYRHFDKAGITPVFPFGYGLSYTRFRYSNLKLSGRGLSPDGTLTVTADITNTGKRSGDEVVELYIHDLQPEVDKPVRELKGFQRVSLQPGETRSVRFALTAQALSYYDTPGGQWKADAGPYAVQIGSSSRTLPLTGNFRLTGTYTKAVH